MFQLSGFYCKVEDSNFCSTCSPLTYWLAVQELDSDYHLLDIQPNMASEYDGHLNQVP